MNLDQIKWQEIQPYFNRQWVPHAITLFLRDRNNKLAIISSTVRHSNMKCLARRLCRRRRHRSRRRYK